MEKAVGRIYYERMMIRTLMAGMLFLILTGAALFPEGGKAEHISRPSDNLQRESPEEGKGMINPYLEYKPFPLAGLPGDYLDKKVTITGRLSNEIWQHLIRGAGDKPYIQECYIDPDDGYEHLYQLVGYNIGRVPFDLSLYEPEHLRFYGTFGIVTGSSKRPGKVDETYSEAYFDIVGIEMLPE